MLNVVLSRIAQTAAIAVSLLFTVSAQAQVVPTNISVRHYYQDTYTFQWTVQPWGTAHLRYKVEGTSEVFTVSNGDFKIASVAITAALKPNTTYIYQIGGTRYNADNTQTPYTYGYFGETSNVGQPVLKFTSGPAYVPTPTPIPYTVKALSKFVSARAVCRGNNTQNLAYDYYVTIDGPMSPIVRIGNSPYDEGIPGAQTWPAAGTYTLLPGGGATTIGMDFPSGTTLRCPTGVTFKNQHNTSHQIYVPMEIAGTTPLPSATPGGTPAPTPDPTVNSTFTNPTATCGPGYVTYKFGLSANMYIDQSINGGAWVSLAANKLFEKTMTSYTTQMSCPTTLKFRNARNTSIVANVTISAPSSTPAPTATPVASPTPSATPSLANSTFTSYSATCSSTKLVTVNANLSGAMNVQRYSGGEWRTFGAQPSPAGAFKQTYQSSTSSACPTSVRIRNRNNSNHTVTVSIQAI